MFVRDDWSRRGLERRILERCESARAEGFRALALMSTLPGLPLYLSSGFEKLDDVEISLPDGLAVAGATMHRRSTQGGPLFVNIGPAEDDGMRSVRSRAKRGAYLRRGALRYPVSRAAFAAATCSRRTFVSS